MRRLTAVLALLVAAPALASNGMRAVGFGPVQVSMGGVGVGASLDAGTILSNPAGMSALGPRADLGVGMAGASVEQWTDYTGVGGSAFADSSDRGPAPFPAFGLVVPLGEDWRLGFGGYQVASLGADYLYGLGAAPSHASYRQTRFAPAVSWRVLDGLSLGAALNLMYATLDAGLFYGSQFSLGGSAFGMGATLSARFSPLSALDLALAVETKGLFQDFRFDTVDAGGTPVRRTATLNQPIVATLGAGFRPVEPLLVAADLEWIGWSGVLGPASSLRLGWQDQVVVKLGAELALEPVRLRAGLSYGKSPLDPNLAFNMMFPAVAEAHLGLGVGVPLGPAIALELGALWSPTATVQGTDATSFGGAVPYRVSGWSYDLQVGVTIAY
ncbi:MAG TPA: outer membrane protein transport protein [Anaeromyxobacteraceae bacterium]|nr:outer membrane protein transport protein [Anaeromyxobacteraceae bacterium]